jgi:hypothetical protein
MNFDDPRLRAFAELLARLDAHVARNADHGRYESAGQILAELVELLRRCGFDSLLAHRAGADALRSLDGAANLDSPVAEAVGRFRRGDGLPVVGVSDQNQAARAAWMRTLLDLRGLMDPRVTDILVGRLSEVNAGERSPLFEPRKHKHGNQDREHQTSAKQRFILLCHLRSGQRRQPWQSVAESVRPVPGSIEAMRAWNKAVPQADRTRAREVGQKMAAGAGLPGEDQDWLESVTKFELSDLARLILGPGAPGGNEQG